MQDWNGCSSLEQDNGSNGDRISITLTDKRDGNTYTVAKLKDGKCWMTQNLRLVGAKNLTSTDSDVLNNYSLPSSTTTSWSSSFNRASVFYYNSNYGAYYSWYAATAGTGVTSSNRTAPNSICPLGWKLPDHSNVDRIVSHYDYNSIQQNPANFVLSGRYYPGQTQPNDSGIYQPNGYIFSPYWTSTAADNEGRIYEIWLYSSRLSSASGSVWAYSGEPIRCISKI